MKFGHLLLFTVLVSLQATATELKENMTRSTEGAMPMVVNSKGQMVSGGRFYGYRNASTGPGDNAFKDALAYVEKCHAPLVMVLDLGGSTGNAFCTDCNDGLDYDGERYLLQFMNGQITSYNTLFCYFRGSQSGPPACKDAWDFAKSLGVPSGDLVYVCYYKYKDGTTVSKVGQLGGSVGSFKGIATFGAQYNLAKDKTSEIRATAAFDCGSGPNSGLQMVSNETETVYVPFVRKENLTNVETNWLAVTYPGETVASTNIEFVWEAAGPAATNLEVAVSVSNRWVEGGKIRLEYLNQDRISFLTNWISCVTVTNGTFDSPWLPGEKAAGELGWGEWTLDSELASNAVLQANAFLYPDTNAVPSYVTKSYQMDWSTSNRYETVYSQNLEGFPKEVVAFEHEFPLVASNMVTTVYTNDLEALGKAQADETFERDFEFEYTNKVTTIYMASGSELPDPTTNVSSRAETVSDFTNRCEYVIADDGSTNFWKSIATDLEFPVSSTNVTRYVTDDGKAGSSDVVTEVCTNVCVAVGTNAYYNASKSDSGTKEFNFPTNFATQCVYTVMPGDGGAATNLHSSVQLATNFTIIVANTVTLLPTNEGTHVEVEYADEVRQTFKVPDQTVYYTTVSNDFVESVLNFSFTETNRVYYTFNGGVTTNADESAFTVSSTNGTACVTNFVTTIYDPSKDTGAVEYRDYCENIFTATISNRYTSVETNEYQYGSAEGRARSALPYQSLMLKVSGSPVWDAQSVSLLKMFCRTEFRTVCENNGIATVLNEMTDPATGASLFSHAIAANGRSGTPFLSRNGLESAALAKPAVGGEFRMELFRPDGSCVGAVKIQPPADDASSNWPENLARILELVATARGEYESDKFEAVNNKPQSGVDVIDYVDSGATTATNTLSISDRCDFFKLTGLQAQKPISVSLVDCNEAKRTQKSGIAVSVVCVTDAEKGSFRVVEPVPCSTNNVWSFSADEIDSVFVRVTAWEAREKKDTGDLASGEGSKVTYRVKVAKAKDEVGTVRIDTASETVEVTESEMPFPIVVSRSGYTGAVKATLTLDTELSTAPATSYQFPDEGVSFSWGADMDFGLQTNETSLVLLNKGDWDEGGDIVLKLDVTEGAVPLVGTNRLWVTVTQRENPSDPTGKIVIGNPSTAERVYLEEGSKLPVRIDRIGGKRGPLAVKITTTDGGRVELPDGSLTNRLDWKRYETTSKSVAWTLPALSGKMSKWDMTLRLTGIDGTPVASNTLNVCVLPAGALKPETGDYRAEVSQYCELRDAKVKFTGTVPAGATLTPTRISGSLPSGVKTPTVDAATNLVFSGVSSKPGTYVSIWWLTVKNEKRQVVGYSYPVKVTIDVKALVEKDKSGKVIGGLNPTFAKARTWTSLPLIDMTSGRLEGLLDLTVATTGKMTARYRKAGGKTVSFSARGLTHVDLKSGLANADASASGYQLKVRLYADSSVAGDIYGPGIALYLHFETKEGSVAWSKDRTAEAWKGNYTLAFAPAGEAWDEKTLCFGSPVLQLKFTSKSQWNSGKVTYAGYLPNGKTVSGSATLVEAPTNAVTVTLPIFATSATDTLSTMVNLSANATEVVPSVEEIVENQEVVWSQQVTSYWDHVEANVSELSYKNLYLPFGSKFVDEGWKAADFQQAVEEATSASYNKTSGLVSGSRRVSAGGKTVSENWKAVVTPGWEVLLAGASWRNVSTNAVNDKTGNPVRRTVQVGEAVEVDAE